MICERLEGMSCMNGGNYISDGGGIFILSSYLRLFSFLISWAKKVPLHILSMHITWRGRLFGHRFVIFFWGGGWPVLLKRACEQDSIQYGWIFVHQVIWPVFTPGVVQHNSRILVDTASPMRMMSSRQT